MADCAGAQGNRLQVGDGGQGASQLGQDGDLFQDPEAVTAHRFRRRARQDAGVDQFRPQGGIDALIEAVKGSMVRRGAHRADDRGDQSAQVLGRFGCGEIHVRFLRGIDQR